MPADKTPAASSSLYAAREFWADVIDSDDWLDSAVADRYERQPLAQDWARVAKVSEEVGEAIAELILWTGQNPRKGTDPAARERLLGELADVVVTGVLAIQHFTKDSETTCGIVEGRMARIAARMREAQRAA